MGWLAAWVVLALVLAVGGARKHGLEGVARAPFVAAVIVGICAAVHYSRPACPKCGSRWGGRWDYARKEGERDLRFKHNAYRCACGHVWGWAGGDNSVKPTLAALTRLKLGTDAKIREAATRAIDAINKAREPSRRGTVTA